MGNVIIVIGLILLMVVPIFGNALSIGAIITFFLSLRGLVMWLIGGEDLWWILGFILTFIFMCIAALILYYYD